MDYGFGALAKLAICGLIIMPLGLWKLVEILVWFWSHIRWV